MPDKHQVAEDTYKTIDSASEGAYRDRASKFLAFAFPVISEEEIRENLNSLKKKYFDANHHCFAWRLGADKKRYRTCDDGEPSNTAGMPIFGQIQSNDLTDVLVVVIRYFGGTKLGVSGLINAYRTAASEALHKCRIVEKTVNWSYEIRFSYNAMNEVMRIIKEEDLKMTNQNFDLNCSIKISVRKSLAVKITDRLKLIRSVEVIDLNIQ